MKGARRARAFSSISGVHVQRLHVPDTGSPQQSLRKCARAGAEVQNESWLHGRNRVCRRIEHRLVAGNEAADRVVVRVDIDTQMMAYAMRHVEHPLHGM